MSVLSRPSTPFHIGDWSIDPSTGHLTRGAEVRRARPLVTDLLLYLASRPGEVVTKDQLIAGPWGGAAVADSALTSTVAELRELLDDQPKAPRYIETLPKRGYRLIADVRALEPPPPSPAPVDVAAPAAETVRDADAPAPFRPSRRPWALAFWLGAAFALTLMVSIAWQFRPRAPAPPARPMRLTVALPDGVKLAPDTVPRIALAGDGSRMAYAVRTNAGTALYTRTIDQFEAHPASGTDDAIAPFFSPDGSRIGYFANGELRTIPVTGGEPAIVCQARVALGASWGPDDSIVFSATHGLGLFEVPAAGGQPRELTHPGRGELSHRWPQVLPDGVHILFTLIGQGRADAWVVSRQSGERRMIVEDANAATFAPPDRIVFERSGRLFAAPIDPTRHELTGPARVIADDLVLSGPGTGNPVFAVASGGTLIYVPVDPHDTQRELVWVDRSGHPSPVGAPPRSYMHPSLSADGRQILTWFRTDDPDLWLFDIASRALTRVATGVAGRRAALSPDGRRVIFDAPSTDNPVSLYTADVSGGRARRLRPDRNSQYAGTWTPDGRTIAYLDLNRKTAFDIVTVADEPDAQPTRLLSGPANETAPAFSPDGRWLAFVLDATGRSEVYVVSYPSLGTPVRVSADGGREPMWSHKGDELFFRQGQRMYAVQVRGTERPQLSAPVLLFSGDFDERPSFHPSYDVADDGRFLMIRGTAPATIDTRIAVLLRWDTP